MPIATCLPPGCGAHAEPFLDIFDAVGERQRGNDEVIELGRTSRWLISRRFVRREVELDARAVGIVEEHLPDAGADLLPADVLDAVGDRAWRWCRAQANGGERHVIDHAGAKLALAAGRR